MGKYLIIIVLGIILVCLSACTEDKAEPIEISKENPTAKENAAPEVNGQSFEIEENTISGTLIGNIEAQDPENDPMKFSMPEIEGLLLDANTGALTIAKGAGFLDFETNEEFEFEVTVSDGNSAVKIKIVFVIINIEDGLLTNFEKNIIVGFKFGILYDSTEFPIYKWTETANIFYSGAVTPGLRSITNNSIQSYNELFTDGFKIEIVDDSLSANVQLFSSTIDDLKKLWPDFGDIAVENPGLGGIAEIGGGRIWIADYAHNKATVRHEMGHMIGLSHAPSSHCAGAPELNSIMCGGVGAAGVDFTELDRKIIKYYYHPEIFNNTGAETVLEKLRELILSDRVAD